MPIENEAAWLACNDPQRWAWRVRDAFDPQRFRWLAISWGERIRQYFQIEDELPYFEAYKAWVEGRAGHPRTQALPEILMPLDRAIEPVIQARFCIDQLERGDPMRASEHAALSSSSDYLYSDDMRQSLDPAHTHRKKSKKAKAEIAAVQMEARERWERERDAHRERTLWQFANEFRDVAGNPFRPVAFDPAWRTETVIGLAVGIDEAGAYERLPILADALQEAGCEDEQVLTHARGLGPHVRGCWLIDMVLGRFQPDAQAITH